MLLKTMIKNLLYYRFHVVFRLMPILDNMNVDGVMVI